MVLAGLGLALGVLLALVFAQYAGVKKKAEQAMTWLAAGAVSFILAEVSGIQTLWGYNVGTALGYIADLFYLIGWILVLIGSIWGIYLLLTAKK